MSENASDPLQDHIDTTEQQLLRILMTAPNNLTEKTINEKPINIFEIHNYKLILEFIHHRERIARLDELKYLLSLGEELYFPYGRSDKVISDRLAELNKEEHE